MSDDKFPEMPEEIAEAIVASLHEIKMIDNGDGTTTQTFVLDNDTEFSVVFDVDIKTMFGEVIKECLVMDPGETLAGYVNTGVVVPNSVEGAE